MAALERAPILSKQAEGIALAKARGGVDKGRARALSAEQADELRRRAAGVTGVRCAGGTMGRWLLEGTGCSSI